MSAIKSTVWKLEPHTLAKHVLLQNYLGGWFGIMGNSNPKIIFLDAFAGPGEYSGGSAGSPLIALDLLLKHPVVKRLQCEFVLIFNELHPQRFEHLNNVLKVHLKIHPLPKNVKVIPTNFSFVDLVEEITQNLANENAPMAPMLAFVDPFGVSGAPLEHVKKLLAFDKSELFTYFNVDTINRFGTGDIIDSTLQELFGTDEFKSAPRARNPERIPYFIELYKKQLKDVCGFTYTLSFQIRNEKGRFVYALIFGTRHPTGLKQMKEAMWKVDPDGTFSFNPRNANMYLPFDLVDIPAALASILSTKFAHQKIQISSIEKFVLVETTYLKRHMRPALKILEAEKKCSVTRNSSPRRAGTFPPDCFAIFL